MLPLAFAITIITAASVLSSVYSMRYKKYPMQRKKWPTLWLG